MQYPAGGNGDCALYRVQVGQLCPLDKTRRARSRRLLIPVLRRMFFTWVPAVVGAM